jgi:hypothetical protein
MLVFKNSFSMIYAKRKKGTFAFKGIPKGKEVIIFSSYDDGKGNVFFSKMDAISGVEYIQLPYMELISKKEFSLFLASIQK